MIGKDLGYLMQPRHILWWSVPRWMNDCVYSKAYTEILYCDDVVTQYLTDEEKKEDKRKYDERRVEETMRKWNERKKRKGKKVSLTENYLNKNSD